MAYARSLLRLLLKMIRELLLNMKRELLLNVLLVMVFLAHSWVWRVARHAPTSFVALANQVLTR